MHLFLGRLFGYFVCCMGQMCALGNALKVQCACCRQHCDLSVWGKGSRQLDGKGKCHLLHFVFSSRLHFEESLCDPAMLAGYCYGEVIDVRHVQTYIQGISGLVAEYIVAIDVTRVRFPADASLLCLGLWGRPGPPIAIGCTRGCQWRWQLQGCMLKFSAGHAQRAQ